MRKTQVSVVMPAYNSANYIKSTIESVINQTYQQLELIIIDDCSTDETVAIVEAMMLEDSRIHLIKLAKNCGAPAKPRNIGIKEAKGHWIALIDSDDIWHPEKLEVQLKCMEENGIQFSSTSSINFVDENKISFDVVAKNILLNKISYKKLRLKLKSRIANSSVVVDKALLIKYPFNENIDYRAIEDYDCWLRIHKEIDFSIKLKEALLFYRISKGQISSNKISMMQKNYMVHLEQSENNKIVAIFFTLTHIAGGIFYRMIKKGF